MKSVLMTNNDSRLERKQWVCAMIVVMALVAGIGLAPQVSDACCFYNLVDKGGIVAEFSCGVFCGNAWDLGPGEHKCRPGKGGSGTIRRGGQSCDIETVKKHGWVEVTRTGNKGLVVSKNENAEIIDSCTFDWVK
jgi:hypothetical protein